VQLHVHVFDIPLERDVDFPHVPPGLGQSFDSEDLAPSFSANTKETLLITNIIQTYLSKSVYHYTYYIL